MKKFMPIVVTLSALMFAFGGHAEISLRVSCKELLDLATYAEYFSDNIVLERNQSREYVLKSNMPGDDVQSKVTIKFLGLDEEAFIQVSWANFYRGRLVEKRSDQMSIERNVPFEIELTARYYTPLFRNSCTLTYQ